jgi:hypothetical protein
MTENVLEAKAFIEGEDLMDQGGAADLVFMTQDMLKELMKVAARTASRTTIDEMEKQREKAIKQNYDLRYKRTKDRLRGYRMLKQKVEAEMEFTEPEEDYWRYTFLEDLMGNPESFMEKPTAQLNKEEAQRYSDRRKLALTDNALTLYETDCQKHGRELDQRRYEEMRMFYGLDSEPMTAQEIAEIKQVTDKAIYKDVGIATKIMSVYLFGTP